MGFDFVQLQQKAEENQVAQTFISMEIEVIDFIKLKPLSILIRTKLNFHFFVFEKNQIKPLFYSLLRASKASE